MARSDTTRDASGSDAAGTRRDVLRLAAAVGLFGSAASCRTPVEKGARLARAPDGVPLGDEYLARGLTALSDAHRRGWLTGHNGAAVLAACYFCRDNRLDARTALAIEVNVDGFMAHQPSRFPTPAPGRGTADPARIVEELDLHVHELRSGGHDAIYAALALRALRDVPELVTPEVVDGIVRLIAAHVADRRPVAETAYQREHPSPRYDGPSGVAEVTLRATLRPWDDVRRIGASGVLHWITHAEAIVTLSELGYDDVARHAYEALRLHVNHPVEAEGTLAPERGPVDWLGPAYWESDAPRQSFGGTWLAGHAFKLPHSAFRLLDKVQDEPLRAAALSRASELLIPFEPRRSS